MEIKIEVPEYSDEVGFEFHWEKGFTIEANADNNTIHIKANKQGLISLANIFLNLAQDAIKQGYHVHLDEYNSLETASQDIVIQKL